MCVTLLRASQKDLFELEILFRDYNLSKVNTTIHSVRFVFNLCLHKHSALELVLCNSFISVHITVLFISFSLMSKRAIAHTITVYLKM